jgi:hypothetical protein
MGRTLQSRLRDFFESPLDATATPLEIVQALLDTLERKVEPLGRGRRVFPYNRILVRVGPTAGDRHALQAAVGGLERRLQERLAELACALPEGTEVRASFLKRAPADWQPGQLFSVECTDAQTLVEGAGPESPQRSLVLTVVKGASTQKSYTFAQAVVSIGRTAEPTDEHGRVRRNDVVFEDAEDGITGTVGRAHARVEYDARRRAYRVFNESASNPTFISRGGTVIQIPPHDPRGVRVKSGDEIHLGRAVVLVEVE